MPMNRIRAFATLVLCTACLAACGHTGAQNPIVEVPADAQAIGEVDYACRSDADCAVKNVGNCCGYYPACVNKDSPTFPEQVMEQCRNEGTMSVCGFAEIAGCACVDNRCEAITEKPEAQLQ